MLYTWKQLHTIPRREVFKRAVQYLEEGHKYSCMALSWAVDDVIKESDTCVNRYTSQYKLWVLSTNNGRLPKWWDALPTHANQAARIAAIKGFAKACGYEL